MNTLSFIELLLGGATAVYMYLHPSAIGFAFPNIERQYAVRPNFTRVALFLFGRWMAYLLIGLMAGWIGFWLDSMVFQRLLWCANIFLAVFMFLFAITANSPELKFANWFDPNCYNWPVFIMGSISALTLVAPFFIAIIQTLQGGSVRNGFLNFTYYFIGNAVISLPILLNIKWHRNDLFKIFIRALFLITGVSVMVYSIHALMGS